MRGVANMRRILILLAALILFAPSAKAANSTVSAMTGASAFGGTELTYIVQGGADRKGAVSLFATYVYGLMTGDCTVAASVITCTKTNGTAFTALATTAPGTGVATALGVNVGSAGAFVTFNGALGTPSSGTATNLTGTAASLTAGTATNAVNTGITDDTTTAATMYPTWVTANTGNLPQKTTSTKLTFNPSTGVLSSTSFTGAGTGLTGTAASLTAGTVTTNANLTGDVTSVGNATSYANVVPAAKGGAGTITGALKANGSGTVSQAACADLSNGTTLCSTTPGTGVATAAAANLSAAGGLTTTIASGTAALGTGAISSAACATVVTVTDLEIDVVQRGITNNC